MSVLIPDRLVRYRELRIDLRSDGPDRFVTTARTEEPSLMVIRSEHKLYVRPEELRASLSATSADGGFLPRRGLVAAMPVKEIGARLFSSLFESTLGSLREREREQARRDGVGLQLRLGFAPSDAAFAGLPWEWMLDTWHGEFLGLLDIDTITRTIADLDAPRPSEPAGLPRMLIVSHDYGQLAISREVEAIRAALSGRVIQIEHAPNPSREAFMSALREVQPTVLHYCGPGQEDTSGQYIAFAAAARDSIDRVTPTELVAMLAGPAMPQIVTFNACTTNSFAFALAPRVRAVAALSALVTDESAIELGSRLYASLGRGTAIDAAVATVRQELAIRPERDLGVPTWAALVLYFSGQAPSLFPSGPRQGLEMKGLSAPPDQFNSRERRKLELRRQTLERNKQDLDERIAAFGPGKVPRELDAQRSEVAAALARLAEEIGR